jgi:Uma2 family endonuclease
MGERVPRHARDDITAVVRLAGANGSPRFDVRCPIMDPAQKLATYDDLLRLPDDVRAEIVDGVVVTTPPPAPEHSRTQRAIGRFIGGPFDDDDGRGGPGGWWIMTEVDVEFSLHRVLRPDVAGWRRERFPEPWGNRPVPVVPDWTCEVLSASKPAHDRVLKRRLYAESGVPFYWIVDPAARTLEALRLDKETGAWIEVGAYDDESVARIAPFEAVELEVGRLFLPRTPDPRPA